MIRSQRTRALILLLVECPSVGPLASRGSPFFYFAISAATLDSTFQHLARNRVDTDSKTKLACVYGEHCWLRELNSIFQDNSPELLECEPAIVYLHEHLSQPERELKSTMVSPKNVFAIDLDAAQEAAKRWQSRRTHHRKVERAKSLLSYSEVEAPERILLRAQRLDAKLSIAGEKSDSRLLVESLSESASSREGGSKVTVQVDEFALERVINRTRDFQFTAFLEQALYVANAVCRIATMLGDGRKSFGTGFLVSPQLLLTNHHVFPTRETALASVAEFGYQQDRHGNILTPHPYRLDPNRFFVKDKELDFALVAVDFSRRVEKTPLVWCPMIKDLGKIITMEHINIIQHPLGEVKQVVIRENRLLDSFDGKDIVMHYEADTEPGSSGSPVFNDQWEVVALHHSGVPRTDDKGRWLKRNGDIWNKGEDPAEIDWVANEGIRTSKIVHAVEQISLKGAARELQQEFLAARGPELASEPSSEPGEKKPPIDPKPIDPEPVNPNSNHVLTVSTSTPSVNPESTHQSIINYKIPSTKNSTYTVTIPIHISISVGEADSIDLAASSPDGSGQTGADVAGEEQEKITPDENYGTRPGYNPQFLGFESPFPKLTVSTRSKAYVVPGQTGDAKYRLDYYHYSILFNQSRKLAFVSGVNYDPTAPFRHPRDKGGDKWFYDPRVTPTEETQAGDDLYAQNPLDRGHLVRRTDAAWGKTAKEAKFANDDTFHFTNCSPQHEITNQGKSAQAPAGLALWGELEEYVASQGKETQQRLSIFNGPIFRDNDRVYRGVKLPKEFWKLIVFNSDAGEPAAAAFKLTQAKLIQGLEESFEFEDYQTVQLSIKDLESETGLDFGKIAAWDSLDKESAQESFAPGTDVVVLSQLKDIVL